MLQINQKAGVDGRLFGSVTNYDVVEALGAQGIEIERSEVRMPQGPLKQVGDHRVEIALHGDVVATITVSVLGES
jgi:large subunit ribosomal protein L9